MLQRRMKLAVALRSKPEVMMKERICWVALWEVAYLMS